MFLKGFIKFIINIYYSVRSKGLIHLHVIDLLLRLPRFAFSRSNARVSRSLTAMVSASTYWPRDMISSWVGAEKHHG